MKRAADIFGDAIRAIDFGHPFGKGAEHLAIIDLLERFAVALIAGNLAHKQDHGGAILECDMHTA